MQQDAIPSSSIACWANGIKGIVKRQFTEKNMEAATNGWVMYTSMLHSVAPRLRLFGSRTLKKTGTSSFLSRSLGKTRSRRMARKNSPGRIIAKKELRTLPANLRHPQWREMQVMARTTLTGTGIRWMGGSNSSHF